MIDVRSVARVLTAMALAWLAGCGPTPSGGSTTPGGGTVAGGGAVAVPPEGDPSNGGASVVGGGTSLSNAAVILGEHNRVRALHCVPPLTWSDELAAVAQAWADELAANGCAFDHSDNPYGENLAGASVGSRDGAGAVAMWYDEVELYDFAGGGFSMETGHFTQVVWKETTAVGCGQRDCDGMTTWVCNYDPAGNSGGYQANVPPRCD